MYIYDSPRTHVPTPATRGGFGYLRPGDYFRLFVPTSASTCQPPMFYVYARDAHIICFGSDENRCSCVGRWNAVGSSWVRLAMTEWGFRVFAGVWMIVVFGCVFVFGSRNWRIVGLGDVRSEMDPEGEGGQSPSLQTMVKILLYIHVFSKSSIFSQNIR